MRARALPIVCALLALSSCERGVHEMYDQPKYAPLKPGSLFANGNSSRPQVPGTQPHSGGALAGASSGRDGQIGIAPEAMPVSGVDARGNPMAQGGPAAQSGYANPLPITPQLLTRGRQRFDIYCAPCHGRAGDGDGEVARRGFPHPPDFHTDALRNAPDSHFHDVITNGYGVMYPYADRVNPHDRWAIVAYIRALQLSQYAPASDLSAEDLRRLDAATNLKLNRSPSRSGAATGAGKTEPSRGASRSPLREREAGEQGAAQ